MKCRILIDIPKTVDGQAMGPYAKGSVHDLDIERAALFIGSAMAEEVIDPPIAEESDVKAVDQQDSIEEPKKETRRGKTK